MNPDEELAMQAQAQQVAGGAPGRMAPQTGAMPARPNNELGNAMPGGGPMTRPPVARPAPPAMPPAGQPGGGMAAGGFGAPRPPVSGVAPATPTPPAGAGMPLPTKAPIQRGGAPIR